MRVLLKLVLDSDPDDAWRALHDPQVFQTVSGPFTAIRSLEPGGFPEVWTGGEHRVAISAFGLVPIGEQIIDLSESDRSGGIRVLRDSGRGESGLLGTVRKWEHTMVVSSAGRGKTLYRDRLVIDVGPLTILAWPIFWLFWQWRGGRMRRLAPTWANK